MVLRSAVLSVPVTVIGLFCLSCTHPDAGNEPPSSIPVLSLAAEQGLSSLKGHRSVGGMRASIYNAMPDAGVSALIDFMQEFERTHG